MGLIEYLKIKLKERKIAKTKAKFIPSFNTAFLERNTYNPTELNTLINYIIEVNPPMMLEGGFVARTDLRNCVLGLEAMSKHTAHFLDWDYSTWHGLEKTTSFRYYADGVGLKAWLDDWAEHLIKAPQHTLKSIALYTQLINDDLEDNGYSISELMTGIATNSPKNVYRFLKDYETICTELWKGLYTIYVMNDNQP